MSTDSKNKFGLAVKAARKKAHLTQEQFAEILNISTTHLKTIKSGRRNPSFRLLQKIVKELDISLDSLFLENENSSDAAINELSIMLRKCNNDQLEMIRYLINSLLQGR